MLTRDGHVKVLDFGIAATLPDDSLERTLSMRNDREIAGIAGTVPYMAPEVLCGSAAGIASDIWALGVVLYEMATGHLPFDRETPSELVASILRDPPAPLPGPMPAPIAQLISRCLTKDPIQRPARAGEIALALEIAPAALGADAVIIRLVRCARLVCARGRRGRCQPCSLADPERSARQIWISHRARSDCRRQSKSRVRRASRSIRHCRRMDARSPTPPARVECGGTTGTSG